MADQLIYQALMGVPVTDQIQSLIRQNPAWRDEFFRAIPRVISRLPSYFPMSGIIRRSGNYYYLEVDQNFAQLSDLLNIIETAYGIDKLVPPGYLTGHHGKLARITISPPPSSAGAHVTLRSPPQLGPTTQLGQTIQFKLASEPVTDYFDRRMGQAPSGLDPRIAPIRWYVLYVTGLPPSLVDPYDRPHISIGLLNYRFV